MKRLPLYTDRRQALDRTTPLAFDATCDRCPIGEGQNKRCMKAAGSPGGLLLVGRSPARDDTITSVPFSTGLDEKVVQKIRAMYDGPMAFTHAVKCFVGSDKISETSVEQCRPYTAQAKKLAKPSKILCFGSVAWESVTGRRVHPDFAENGYAYLEDGTVAYLLKPYTSEVDANKWARAAFEKQLEWAIKGPKPPPPPYEGVAWVVETLADAEEAVRILREAMGAHKTLVCDTEFSGPQFTKYFRVDCLALAVRGSSTKDAYVWSREALADPDIRGTLGPFFEDPEVRLVAHNAKVELKVIGGALGFDYRCKVGDTLIWAKLDDPRIRADLEWQAERVGMGGHKEENEKAVADACAKIAYARAEYTQHQDVLGCVLSTPLEAAIKYPTLDAKSFAYGMIPADTLHRYCALDTVSAARLVGVTWSRVYKKPNLKHVWDNIMAEATDTFAWIERWGIGASDSQITMVATILEANRKRTRAKLMEFGEFDPDSAQDRARFFYQVMGLPVTKETDSGAPSTDKHAIARLQSKNLTGDKKAFLDTYSEYRQYDTLTRFGGPMMDFIRDDFRIHPSYTLTGTETGRISCNSPNLQQAPSRGELAPMIKNIFVAPPGYCLAALDFSQMEYRVAAALSGDKKMLASFLAGEDIHRSTANLIAPYAWNIPTETLKAMDEKEAKNYRYAAKTVVFSLLYGKGAYGLAQDLGITEEEAQTIINAVIGQLPQLGKWLKSCHDLVQTKGGVYTYWDGKPARFRPLWGIASGDMKKIGEAKRASTNSPVQGSASEYTIKSLIELVKWILSDHIPAKIVATVHDSILLEIRNDFVDIVVRMALDIMTSWPCGGVPIQADAEISYEKDGKPAAWGRLEKWRGSLEATMNYKAE